VLLQDASGAVSPGDLTKLSSSIDVAQLQTTQNYPWGQLRLSYAAAGSRIQITVSVTNTSKSTIQQLRLEPLTLVFPSKPLEYDGSTPILSHNLGGTTVLPLTYSKSMLALTNDDVSQPLLIGFPASLDPPASTVYTIVIQTGQSTYSDRLPPVDRPVAPGGTIQFHLSLRFGPAGTPLSQLAADVYQQFNDQTRFRFGWTDRRPVGTLFLASSAAGYPKNPRGWFNDPSVDTTTPAGIAAFQTSVLAWADTSVSILKDMGAQGAIVWDIEGEENPQPTTYIGDPRLVSLLAPELDPISDAFFKKFTDAGLQVGITLRPQQFQPATDSTPASQQPAADVVGLLNAKIAYARERWKASLFYIDSNGDPSFPIDFDLILQVQQANPGVLLIPEHKNFSYYTVSAPYAELRQGYAATPQVIRDTYPAAFSFINTADGPVAERFAELVRAVSQGDVLLFRGWWNDPTNAQVKAVYQTAAAK